MVVVHQAIGVRDQAVAFGRFGVDLEIGRAIGVVANDRSTFVAARDRVVDGARVTDAERSADRQNVRTASPARHRFELFVTLLARWRIACP
jgi:hypothetical protein